jgi:hypothetical protein
MYHTYFITSRIFILYIAHCIFYLFTPKIDNHAFEKLFLKKNVFEKLYSRKYIPETSITSTSSSWYLKKLMNIYICLQLIWVARIYVWRHTTMLFSPMKKIIIYLKEYLVASQENNNMSVAVIHVFHLMQLQFQGLS